MSGLSVDKELVDCGDLEILDESQVDAHADAREQVHCLFTANSLSVAEDSVGATDLVVKVLLAFADEEFTGLAFVVDDDGNDVADFFDEFFFGATECDMVANLIEVAHGLRASSVQTSHGEADFLQAAEDFLNLLR